MAIHVKNRTLLIWSVNFNTNYRKSDTNFNELIDDNSWAFMGIRVKNKGAFVGHWLVSHYISMLLLKYLPHSCGNLGKKVVALHRNEFTTFRKTESSAPNGV